MNTNAKQKQELKTKYDELLKVVEGHKRVTNALSQILESNSQLTHCIYDLVHELQEREVYKQTGSYPETKRPELKIVNS